MFLKTIMKIIVANNFHSNFEKNKNRRIQGKKCNLKIPKKWFSSIYWKNHNKGNDWSLIPLTLVMTKSDLEKNYYQQFVSKLQIIKKLTWRFKRPKLL